MTINISGGFFVLLTALFIGLKLTGFIAWSWWWVLSPLWLPFALLIIGAGGIFIGWIAARAYVDYKESSKSRLP